MTDDEYGRDAPVSAADAGGVDVGTQAVSRDELCDDDADVGTQAASVDDLDIGTQAASDDDHEIGTQAASIDDHDIGTQKATLDDLDVGTQHTPAPSAHDGEDDEPTDRVSGRSGPTIRRFAIR